MAKQQNQIRSYLSESEPGLHHAASMPNYRLSTSSDIQQQQQQQTARVGSAPVDPDSPLSVGMSSTATSLSEVKHYSLHNYVTAK